MGKRGKTRHGTKRHVDRQHRTRICKECRGRRTVTIPGFGVLPDYTRKCDRCQGRGTL